MKSCYVDYLRDGARVDDIFLVTNKSLGRTQDGSAYVRFKLSDRTGTVEAIKWDASESAYNTLSTEDFVHVRGVVGTYRDKLQIVIESFRRCSEQIDPTDFLPRSERDPDEMLDVLRKHIASIEEPSLQQVLKHFFSDEEFVAKFKAAPAGQRIHHAYIGGLLEHTLGVVEGCDSVAANYPQLNRDLLVTGAILHDIGKVEEFCWTKSIRYSDVGHLLGHIVVGTSMVEAATEKIQDMPEMLRLELLHMILSHHGEKEWGSPKRPKSLQAIVLHHLDDLDAKVNMVLQATKNTENGDSPVWTEKHWVLDRPLLRNLQKPEFLPVSEDNGDGKNGHDVFELPF